MPISPTQYASKAAEFERLAERTRDPAIRQGYLDVAAELRRLAGKPLARSSDSEIERLAERMIGNAASKL
jgi:hypothetical protein